MNKYRLYRLISKNADLKDERHPMLDKNRFMKFLIGFMWLYYAAVLIFMGVVMGIGMKHSYNGVAAYHVSASAFRRRRRRMHSPTLCFPFAVLS